MTERRFLDEVDENEEEQKEEPAPIKQTDAKWMYWLHLAGSLAAVTAISLLTLEIAMDNIRLGILAAYALGSSLLIGILFILIIIYRFALSKLQPGLWRLAFWFISVPIAFLYYLLFVFIIYGQFSPLLVKLMGAAMSNAP